MITTLVPRFALAGLLASLCIVWESPAQEGGAAAPPPQRAGAGFRGQRALPPLAPLPLVTEMLPAQFQVTVYEVQATEQARALDPKALAGEAGTAPSLLRALNKAGKACLLYQIEQPVNAFSEDIQFGASEPVIRGSRTNNLGGPINLVSYANVGLILRLSATAATNAAKAPPVTLALQLARVSSKAAPDSRRPGAGRSLVSEQTLPLEFGQPRVLLSENLNAADEQADRVLYCVRYQFESVAGQGGAADSAALGQPRAEAKSEAAAGSIPAEFEAEVFQVKASADRLNALDAKALARQATTVETLLKALDGVDESRIVHQAEQPVNVCSDQLQVITNEMITTGMRMVRGPGGERPLSAMTGQNVGLMVRLAAPVPASGASPQPTNVSMALQFSALVESETELGGGVKAKATRMGSVKHSEPLEFGRPRVMVFWGSTSAEAPAAPDAFVVRYLFKPPVGK